MQIRETYAKRHDGGRPGGSGSALGYLERKKRPQKETLNSERDDRKRPHERNVCSGCCGRFYRRREEEQTLTFSLKFGLVSPR